MQDTLESVIGSRVQCAGDECGEVESVVVDPVADKLTRLVVRPDGPDGAGVSLGLTKDQIKDLPPVDVEGLGAAAPAD